MTDILNYQSKWLRRSHVLRTVLGDTKLPALPVIIRRLESLLEAPRTNAGDVAILLESEPVIAGRVVHLANSAYYGSGRHDVTTVDRAVSRLGLQTIRGLVYSASLPELFHGKGFRFNHMLFWKHSLTVAFLSRDLVLQRDKNAVESSDQAYLAGLMHDIGILLFAKGLPENYDQLTTGSKDLGRDLHFLEEELLGIDHSELGSMFLEKQWSMDPLLLQAVRLHHSPPSEQPPSHPYSASLFMANAICSLYGITNGATRNNHIDNLSLLATLAEMGVELETVERLLKMAEEGVSSIEQMLSP